MKTIQRLLIIGCLVVTCCSMAGVCFGMTPTETMEKTVYSILAVLDQGDTTDENIWTKQREGVSRIVSDRFDMREMAKRALAKYWKKRTPAEQDDFAELFSELIKNTYIERLRSFSGTRDGTTFDKEIVRGQKSVVSSVVWQNGNEISVVYKMYMKDGTWFVYDVVIENVSLVRNYRSQFAQAIQKNGYEALVRKIEDKLAAPPVIGEHGGSGE